MNFKTLIKTTSILSGLIIISACGGGSGGSSSGAAIAAATKPINDTGILTCGDYAYTDSGTNYNVSGSGTHSNDLNCATIAAQATQTADGMDADGDIVRAGQDAVYGRDVTNNDNSDGHAGFSFTKLDSSGTALANQTQTFATTPWDCVRDNVTGLIWEVKQNSGLRDPANFYSWYNSTGTNDGGGSGTSNTGTCSNSNCDTESFVAAVNASNTGAGICGAADWRLPSMEELASIMNNNTTNPTIDVNYFPNTKIDSYWTSSPSASATTSAWQGSFVNGELSGSFKSLGKYVRLVRNN
ncbi:MAG: DUF1566 domain-containing protein [Woeseiaceae bacterium]